MARDTGDRFVWVDVDSEECPTITDAKLRVRTSISLRTFGGVTDTLPSLVGFLKLVIVEWEGFDLELPDGVEDLTFAETKYLVGLAMTTIRDPHLATSAATH